jgi:hypothetical protein
MNRALILLVLCVAAGASAAAAAAAAGCRTAPPLALRVRFAAEAARDVLLESTLPDGLRMVDAATGHELWSAGSRAGASQQIAAMNAPFGASLTAVHLDADGLHDRIYAGDRAGRLWRLDLHAGARPSGWLRAAVLAELGAPGGGRGFVAAPDIALIEADAGAWLNVAIGTANTGPPRSDHRFYVLRDALAANTVAPLTESDLEPVRPPLGIASGMARGYYLPLGTAQVLARALTLDGRIHFTVVESAASLLTTCDNSMLPTSLAPISVTVLRAADGAVATDSNGDGHIDQRDLRRTLARAMPASSAVELIATPAPADGLQHCAVDAEPLSDCALDTRPRRSWWRREDAD